MFLIELNINTSNNSFTPAMDSLPRVLENLLETLLRNHVVSSWKISADGFNPTIVLRLKASGKSQDNGHCAPQHFRAKPPSQIERDRKRMHEYRQRLHLNQNTDGCTRSDRLINVNLSETYAPAIINNEKCKVGKNTLVKETVSTCDMLCDTSDPNQSRETTERTGQAENTGGAPETGQCEGAVCDLACDPDNVDNNQLNDFLGPSVPEKAPRAARDRYVSIRRRGRSNRADNDDKEGGHSKTITNEMDCPSPITNDACAMNSSNRSRSALSPRQLQKVFDALNEMRADISRECFHLT